MGPLQVLGGVQGCCAGESSVCLLAEAKWLLFSSPNKGGSSPVQPNHVATLACGEEEEEEEELCLQNQQGTGVHPIPRGRGRRGRTTARSPGTR